jgi:putative NADH-flavin reductase
MKVAVFGAGGPIGSAITAELLARGYMVTAVTRSGTPIEGLVVQVATGDAADPVSVARLAAGQDAVVSAVGPHRGAEYEEDSLVGAARGLIAGLRKGGVRRLVVVGGAGSLQVAPGLRLVDTRDFPAGWKPVALAHAAALDVYRDVEDLDWTFVCPAAVIEPGERTGAFRIGGDDLLSDAAGESRISIPDFAIAVADVLERGEAIRGRITVAY